MPRRPGIKLDMPTEYTPEVEYSVNLGAESGVSTPLLSPSLTTLSDSSASLPENILDDTPAASPIRTRSWRPVGVEREQKARSTAYDAAGNLKVAARARKADARDCGICQDPAVSPVKTLCCGALFCRQHIDDWIYAPAADGCCPACKARCVLPASRPASPPPSPSRVRALRPRTPPSSRSGSREPAPRPPTAAPKDPAAPAPRKRTTDWLDLVRLLSGLVALVLLIGAVSRRGGVGGEGE